MNGRLLLVLVSAVVVQAAVAPQLRILGSTPQVLLLVGITAGMRGGPDRGATIGFAAGVGMDLLTRGPFGLWALTTTLVGWAAGHLHGRAIAPGPVARVVTAGVGTAVGVVGFVVMGSLLGQSHLGDLPVGALVLSLSLANMALVPLAVRVLGWAGVEPESKVRA